MSGSNLQEGAQSAERFSLLKVPQPVAHALSGRSDERVVRPNKALQPTAQRARRG